MNPVMHSWPGIPLVSERLRLREFVPADEPAVHAYASARTLAPAKRAIMARGRNR